jgi:HTH-type transcriptional regulator/antitoxin HigA
MKAIAPGEHLREELAERGWTQSDFAKILERPLKVINEIINGKRAITTETAKELSRALDTSAEVWLNLESAYRLALSNPHADQDSIVKRAALYSRYPVGEMIRRRWIRDGDIDSLERAVFDFFSGGLGSFAARTGSRPVIGFNPPQEAWLYRIARLSRAVSANSFDLDRFRRDMASIRSLAGEAEETRHVPKVLADLGVKFLIVEHLKGTKIDGACIWVQNSPVVALSLRFDRVDYFWHTLIHELEHVFHEDGLSLDEFSDGGLSDAALDYEKRADESAANFLVPKEELHNFMLRAGPLYTRQKIEGFAARIGIHPGIVVGQIQRAMNDYSIHRKLLERVNSFVIPSALTDGWGSAVEDTDVQ